MRTIIALCLGAGVFLGAGRSLLRATEPAGKPHTGRVLVLTNERTLTGDIEQVGEQFRVKRLVGETWVPADQVLRLCVSLEEALGVLRGRANLNDPDERLRLSDWCRQHGLRQQARDELKAACAIRPDDARLRRMLGYLEQALQREQARPVVAVEKPVPRVDVTAESLGLFASKVQPILMNTCLRCHTAGRGGQFQLTRVAGPGMSNRRSLDRNLTAVLAEVDARAPRSSRLLNKAVSIHARGMTQAPLKDRQTPAFRTLQAWVLLTVESNPQLREQALAGSPPVPSPAPSKPSAGWGADRAPAAAPPAPAAAPTAPATTPSSPAASKPLPAPAPAAKPAEPSSPDPVSPEEFNRQFHPQPPGSEKPQAGAVR